MKTYWELEGNILGTKEKKIKKIFFFFFCGGIGGIFFFFFFFSLCSGILQLCSKRKENTRKKDALHCQTTLWESNRISSKKLDLLVQV